MALWLTVAEGDGYFLTRHGVGTLWTDLSDPAGKTALLTTAQQDIEVSEDYTFPATVEQAQKDAVCEQALFRLLDPDVDTRAAVQSQGVKSAGIVEETYDQAEADNVALAPKAKALLKEYMATGQAESSGGFEWSR